MYQNYGLRIDIYENERSHNVFIHKMPIKYLILSYNMSPSNRIRRNLTR